MLTLAVAHIVCSLAFQWTEVTGGDNGILGVWPERWAASPSHFYWLSLAVAALVVGALRIITFSPFGFALRANRDSPLRSESIGIDGKALVHSAKDMPTFSQPGLTLTACLEREDPRDVFISRKAASLGELPKGATLGTTSLLN